MSKLAKYLISDLKGDWSKPSIKFFRSNGAYGYIIWLTLINCYFEKKDISIEKLVNDVQTYASRRTVLDFINRGVEGKFINKKNSIEDKRKIFIEPSKTTIKEYSEWSSTFIKSIVCATTKNFYVCGSAISAVPNNIIKCFSLCTN